MNIRHIKTDIHDVETASSTLCIIPYPEPSDPWKCDFSEIEAGLAFSNPVSGERVTEPYPGSRIRLYRYDSATVNLMVSAAKALPS